MQRIRGARGIAAAAVGALAAMTLVSNPAHAAVAAAPDPDHLIAHYDFDGDPASTGTLVDRSGHGLDATIVNKATATSVPGAEAGDSALDLPGGAQSSTGAYVDLPKNLLGSATDLTVSARVKWDGSGGSWQRIFDIGQDTNHYLFAAPSNGDGNLRAAVKASPPSDEAYTTGYAALPSDGWKTVTVTLDTAKHQTSLYLDGAFVDHGEDRRHRRAAAQQLRDAGGLHRQVAVRQRSAVQRGARRLPGLRPGPHRRPGLGAGRRGADADQAGRHVVRRPHQHRRGARPAGHDPRDVQRRLRPQRADDVGRRRPVDVRVDRPVHGARHRGRPGHHRRRDRHQAQPGDDRPRQRTPAASTAARPARSTASTARACPRATCSRA